MLPCLSPQTMHINGKLTIFGELWPWLEHCNSNTAFTVNERKVEVKIETKMASGHVTHDAVWILGPHTGAF